MRYILLILFFISLDSLASDLSINDHNTRVIEQKAIAWELAEIKSVHTAEEEASKSNSPLKKLSPYAQRVFIDSLVFTENGLGGFNYTILEEELTPTEIYKVLQLIGAQHTITMFTNARIETKADLLLMSQKSVRQAINSKSKESDSEVGVQSMPAFGADHKGYECLRRATCSRAERHICMGGC